MEELKGNNGATIKIGIAPWKDTVRLKNVVVKELSKTGIELNGLTMKSDVNELLQKMIRPLLNIDGSDEFNDAVMKCMMRCQYNNDRITDQTFESVEAREDYYIILIKVLMVNLSPFFRGLVSGLPQVTESITTEQTPK